MWIKHYQEEGGGVSGALWGSAQMLQNKSILEPFFELWNNRSYYGYDVWDPEANLFKKGQQAAFHIMENDLNPMSVGGALKAAQLSGKSFPSMGEAFSDPGAFARKFGEAAMAKGVPESFAGFGPAPAYVEKTRLENRISHLYERYVAPFAKPYEQEDVAATKSAARNALKIATQNGDQAAARAARADALKAGIKAQYLTPSALKENIAHFLFAKLPWQVQREVLEGASEDEVQEYLPKASAKAKAAFKAGRAGDQPLAIPAPADFPSLTLH